MLHPDQCFSAARLQRLAAATLIALLLVLRTGSVRAGDPPVGVVSHIKVLSDKVADVSSLEAWKNSFIKPGMTDKQKVVALWKSSVSFVYQDAPPIEFLHEGCVHDTIKSFNVYGYGMCCCASARIEQMARYLGLQARGYGINAHSVPEVCWDNEWHLLDASLANYFTRSDGKISSLSDITQAVQGWLQEHPDCRGNGAKLDQIQRADGWTGWKRGPALLANCAFYDSGGCWPARTHGWASTMQEYDGSHGTPFPFEYGYSQGYEVNIQLRRGERLTRNWFNNGLHVNGVLKDGDTPGCLTAKVGEGSLVFLRGLGDLTDGRIGSGQREYEVPLAEGSLRAGALAVENVACQIEDQQPPAIHPRDASQPGSFDLGMPSSYVYLTGKAVLNAVVGPGGKVRLLFSDNNGLTRFRKNLNRVADRRRQIRREALRLPDDICAGPVKRLLPRKPLHGVRARRRKQQQRRQPEYQQHRRRAHAQRRRQPVAMRLQRLPRRCGKLPRESSK